MDALIIFIIGVIIIVKYKAPKVESDKEIGRNPDGIKDEEAFMDMVNFIFKGEE